MSIEVSRVTKSYKRITVLDELSFTCPPGSVTGFLGPNGAGKSTALRILLGLARPDKGTATISGLPFGERRNGHHRVGAMLDASALHPGRTVRETLKIQSLAVGQTPVDIEASLASAGLTGTAKRLVSTFSLGMRQRLGIAMALIGNPTVLILDEPYNGLDPEGIYWIRTMLREFANRGGTALVSTHLLNEAKETIDRLVLVSGGKVLASGELQSLLAGSEVAVRVDPREEDAFQHALSKAATPFRRSGGRLIVQSDPYALSGLLVSEGIRFSEFTPQSTSTIEDLYFSLTGTRPSS